MRQIFLCTLLSLAACSKDEPPAPSAEESAQLNEADAMLNSLANEEGSEAEPPDPSNNQ